MKILKCLKFTNTFLLVLALTLIQNLFCEGSNANPVNQIEKQDEKPVFETIEEYFIWFGEGCPDKKDYQPDTFSEKKKQELIQKSVLFFKQYPRIYSCEKLFSFYIFKQDLAKALYWAQKGAEQGSGDCMAALFYSYAVGQGVVKDNKEAMVWLILAAAKGHEHSLEILKDIKEDMTEDEITIFEDLNERAKEWSKEHPEAFFDPN